MKALLICASHPASLRLGAESGAATLRLLGQTLLEYWLTHLASNGFRRVLVLAHQQVEAVSAITGGGERWGLEVEVVPESRQLTAAQALLKYGHELQGDHPQEITLLDHFPSQPELPLFQSYPGFYQAVAAWMPKALTRDRVGIRALKPDVFVGTNAKISPSATLRGPLWIGRHTVIGPGAILGPGTIIEDSTLVSSGAEISASYVSHDTFIGAYAELTQSLVLGSWLVDLPTGSATEVVDPFWVCSLRPSSQPQLAGGLLGRLHELYRKGRSEVAMATKHFAMDKEG